MKKKEDLNIVDTAYLGVMMRCINEFYKGCCMIDMSPFLSSSPPKSSETGGKGLKAEALGLSTGGAAPAFVIPSHQRPGKRCHDCKKRFIGGRMLEKPGEIPDARVDAKNKKRKDRSPYIIYLPGSKTHGYVVMVRGNSPTPNLPSPPFLDCHGHPLGSTCSLDPITAAKTQRLYLKKSKVTSLVSLCLCGGCE